MAGEITVTGLKSGDTTITIAGSNAETLKVDIKVSNIIKIEPTSLILNVGESKNVTITNLKELSKVHFAIRDTEICDGEINEDKTIKVTGLKAGETIADVDAANCPNVEYKITVNAVVPPKKQLSEILKVTELGELANNQEATIRQSTNSKNTGLTDAMYDLTAITNTTATANGKGDYEGNVPLTFTVKEPLKQLNTVITQPDLGEIADKQEATIRKAVTAKNNNATDAMYDLSDITDTTANAKGKGEYTGTVALKFTIKKPIPELSTIITEKVLGELENGEDATVLAGMEAKNANAKGKAKIKSNDKTGKVTFEPANPAEYSGTVDCTYTIKVVEPEKK